MGLARLDRPASGTVAKILVRTSNRGYVLRNLNFDLKGKKLKIANNNTNLSLNSKQGGLY